MPLDEDSPIWKEIKAKGIFELTELNDAIWESTERGWRIKSMHSNIAGNSIVYTILLESGKATQPSK